MIKKFSYFLYKILTLLDKGFNYLTKRSILIYFKEFFLKDSYKNINILDKNINFFTPNEITEWRVKTFFTKEPETIEWIDGFKNKKNLIFWDIGANVGLYSIYNSLKNTNSTTISFEPSSSNLRVLTRNISINNLEDKIKVFPLPLTNKKNKFLIMKERDFVEGGALNSFGEDFDFEGKSFTGNMKYSLIGTTIDYLIEKNILEIPDHIKIDVDGIEHLILDGGKKILKNKKIMSMSIEINENFKEQFSKVMEIMHECGFRKLHKKHNSETKEVYFKGSKFNQSYNYIFIR